VTHRWPQVLPGGKAVLFTEHGTGFNFDDANIVVQPLRTGQRKIVQRGGTFGRYFPGGYLVYLHSGTLFAAPFDVERLEMVGTPVPAVEAVQSDALFGGAQIAFSSSGTLLYLSGPSTNWESAVFWMERDGKTVPLRRVPARYTNIRLSPDGRRLAMNLLDANREDIWVYECQRDTTSRFTFGTAQNSKPVWTPDGLRIAFGSDCAKPGVLNIYWQRADGAGEVQRLTESNNRQRLGSWHPSGRFLAFAEAHPQTGWDIMILPMEGSEVAGWKPGKPFVFLNSPNTASNPAFSPDGRWLAFMSDESGKVEVYVRPFPGPGGRWQISTNGGYYPTWSPKGKELLYKGQDSIMVAAYTASEGVFQPETPRPWSSVSVPPLPSSGPTFDVGPDGKRVAVLLKAPDQAQAAAQEDKITFFFNFTDELRRIVPAGKR
jgi:serine/threonine-protein kinase